MYNIKKKILYNKNRRLRNRYSYKTVRTIVKKIRKEIEKARDIKYLESYYSYLSSKLDTLAKKKIIHKNKAANLKSKLASAINAIK
ncbi:MAG: 30S ribosomal protein S20 [Candidatus Walczuchella monophlebidarum]|uniref:30S ribosomal protein S20 n=1 Tax=Candidatus Walczuchella endosymbiont of Icerya purchasi TaxID=3066219 RepID=UPI00313B1817